MSQISIIKKSDIQEARRFDAEFFKPFNLKSAELVTSKGYSLLEDIGEFIIGPFGSTVKVEDYVKDSKYKYIRGKDVKNGLINDLENSAISEGKYNSLPKYHLEDGDILMTVVGTLGNIGIYRKSFGPAMFSCKSTVLRPRKISSEIVMIFLSTKYGKSLLMRNERGAIQKGFNLPDLKNIPIPILSQSFQLQIEKIVKSAYEKQTQSKQLYKEAEEALLKEVDLLDYKPEQILSYETTKKETDEAERFDAEYFQPKYEEIIKKIEKYKNGWDFVKNIVHHKKGVEVGSETYQQDGMSFGRVSDFSINGVERTGKKISKGLYQELRKDYQPKRNDILFTKDGTIGLSYVVKEEFEVILSGAFLRLSLKEKYQSFEKECLSLIFNSIISKMQVEKLSGGAIIAHLKPSDFEKFKIPLIKPQIQKQIAKKIQKSHKLRKESKELLEEAKRKVEEEIEK